jgi:3-keto-disaccharide hydrolase
MKPAVRCLVVRSLFAAAALLVVEAASAADGPKQEVDYTSLFNGKDLTGWHYGPEQLAGKTETADKRFQVIDGVIVANVGKGIKDLYTTRSYDKDFHLKLEFRAAPRADSGLYIRGKQLQVRDYPTVGPYKNLKHFKNGDWNELDVTVRGTTARCKCNDEVVEEAFKIPAKGENGLQAEVGKFEFRRIRIKELP